MERAVAGLPSSDIGSRIIPLNRPVLSGKEYAYIRDALDSGHLAGGGSYTKRVEDLIAGQLGAPKVFLTPSCTAALEIAALLTVSPGDEVILPSFTFVATGSAFARAGAKLVFVDIDRDTFNIDPRAVEAAITPRTKAVVAMHYAGVGCDLVALRQIADAANVRLIEDAAHGFGARYRGRPLGTCGQLSAISFHESKNIMSGEGGALVVNDRDLIDRAQVIRDRGTNRERFSRREIDQYTWVDLGSAYSPSEMIAAFLLAQIEMADAITAGRLRLWQRYYAAFEALERAGVVRRPIIPAEAVHNGHIFHLLLADTSVRPAVLAELNRHGIGAAFHYVPLHSSPAGRKYGRTAGPLAVTDNVAGRLIRLPLYLSMSEQDQNDVIDAVTRAVARRG